MTKQAQVENALRPMVNIAGYDWRRTIWERMAHYNVPAVSVAVIKNGELDWAQAYGTKAVGSREQVNTGTLFQFASVSKAVTALGILTLVDEDKVSLDADVNEYLSSWKLKPNPLYPDSIVTLRRILSHTAGLNVHGFMGYDPEGPLPTLKQILDGVAPANSEALKIEREPGSACKYSGGGTTLAALLMSDVLEQPFPEAMQKRVLDPLGMTRSFYAALLPEDRLSNVAFGHKAGTLLPHNYVATPELGPDGLWSTPTDIARFALAISDTLCGKQKVPVAKKLIAEMLTPQDNAKFADGYFGLGPILTGEAPHHRFGHSGYNQGYMSNFVHYNDGRNGAVITTNADEGFSLLSEIMTTIAGVYEWPGYDIPTYSKELMDKGQLSAYAGVYQFIEGGLSGTVGLELEEASLFCTLSAGYLPRMEIVPIGGDVFVMTESPHKIIFRRNEYNKICALSFTSEGVELWKAERL